MDRRSNPNGSTFHSCCYSKYALLCDYFRWKRLFEGIFQKKEGKKKLIVIHITMILLFCLRRRIAPQFKGIFLSLFLVGYAHRPFLFLQFLFALLHRKLKQLKKPLLFVGITALGLLLFSFASRVRAAANLIFKGGGVTGLDFNGNSPVLHVNLLIQNTSSIDVPIKSLSGDLTAGGQYLGNISTFIQTTIPGNSQSILPMDIALNPTGVVSNLFQAWQNGSLSQKFNLKGFVNLADAQLPLDIDYQL